MPNDFITLMGINTIYTPGSRHTKLLLVISVPLPLQTKFWSIKLITLNRIHIHMSTCFRHLISLIRFPTITFCRNLAHHWPIILPGNRLEMDDTSISFLILEMNKPILSIFGMNPSTLMRAVNQTLSLCQNLLRFIRTER